MRRSDKKIGIMLIDLVAEYGPVGYRKLQAKAGLYSQTYDRWISKLRKCNILTQSPKDKMSRPDGKPGGRTIPTELTDTAKKKLKLGILSILAYKEGDKQKKLAELYQLILYFLAAKPGQYDYWEFYGEKQRINEILTHFLLNCCSVDKLEEEQTIPHEWNHKIIRVVYKSPSPCIIVWKEITTAADDPSKSGTLYHMKILGLSVYDVCFREDRPFFKNIKFTPEEIQSAFDRLVDTGIMEMIGDIWGARRYDFVDEWLRAVIRVLWSHQELVLNEMYPLFDTKFHLPYERMKWLKDRRKWLSLFHDKEELNARIRNNLHEHVKKGDVGQWTELILHDYEELKQRSPNKIAKYGFILDRLLEVAYPPFLERAVRVEEAKRRASFRKKHRLFLDYASKRDKHPPESRMFVYYSDKMVEYCMKH